MLEFNILIDIWHNSRIYLLIFIVILFFWNKKKQQTKNSELKNKSSGSNNQDNFQVINNSETFIVKGTDDKNQEQNRNEIQIKTQLQLQTKKERSRTPKVFTGRKENQKNKNKKKSITIENLKIIIFYSTLRGTSKTFSLRLQEYLKESLNIDAKVIDLDYVFDLDFYFSDAGADESLKNTAYIFILPSYSIESTLDFLIQNLTELYNDFRINSKPLEAIAGYSVFGLGDKEKWPENEYDSKYCYQAKLVDKYLGKLGGKRIAPLGTGDVSNNVESDFNQWKTILNDLIKDRELWQEVSIYDSSEESDDGEEEEEEEEEKEISSYNEKSKNNLLTRKSKKEEGNGIVDLEDMGLIIKNTKEMQKKNKLQSEAKEMVSKDSPTYKSLVKQGYTIVGTHSGVKICRWTKSALRGRGSCYKFAFYGIKSHLCMEATPSLSCSSKCVFCWRHGTNPVGTTWRWKTNSPEEIVEGAMEGHYKKIKQMRGVPGVQADRFAEAFTIRHCALSLVGEPIFYPHINKLVSLLHDKHISTFLVCNAQHPDQLEAMKQVTQLYVSIDASSKDSLKRIDRPLHRDFWERFNRCLSILKQKSNQRTVFRLTLVKGFNINEVEGYADLIEKAEPCFIEIKGVTYCGTSKENSLTMKNVPYYEEVKEFAIALRDAIVKRNLDYDLATEHAHSCCILLAQKKFYIDNQWYTHIDYNRFFKLLESGETFGPLDYISPTPEWAVFGSAEAGFNPEDEKWTRKSAKIENAL